MNVILKNSIRKDKRYMVLIGNKTIYFGSNYENYTIHKDVKRKESYILRHHKNEDWNNPLTAGFWAKNILWNKPSLNESIKDTEKRFNLIIKRDV